MQANKPRNFTALKTSQIFNLLLQSSTSTEHQSDGQRTKKPQKLEDPWEQPQKGWAPWALYLQLLRPSLSPGQHCPKAAAAVPCRSQHGPGCPRPGLYLSGGVPAIRDCWRAGGAAPKGKSLTRWGWTAVPQRSHLPQPCPLVLHNPGSPGMCRDQGRGLLVPKTHCPAHSPRSSSETAPGQSCSAHETLEASSEKVSVLGMNKYTGWNMILVHDIPQTPWSSRQQMRFSVKILHWQKFTKEVTVLISNLIKLFRKKTTTFSRAG